MANTAPSPLQIPQSGDLDFLALGALIHRLDPGVVPFHKAQSLSVHVSGGEFNCAAYLADCFGLSTGFATAMVWYPIGDLIAEQCVSVAEVGELPSEGEAKAKRPSRRTPSRRPSA